ncbi:MAG TPA: hypothetical protein VJT82_02845 [Pyrinomonadaceae bacterium]|nr:hypothetical protein [Pyrinomonadaceae bacterium]
MRRRTYHVGGAAQTPEFVVAPQTKRALREIIKMRSRKARQVFRADAERRRVNVVALRS